MRPGGSRSRTQHPDETAPPSYEEAVRQGAGGWKSSTGQSPITVNYSGTSYQVYGTSSSKAAIQAAKSAAQALAGWKRVAGQGPTTVNYSGTSYQVYGASSSKAAIQAVKSAAQVLANWKNTSGQPLVPVNQFSAYYQSPPATGHVPIPNPIPQSRPYQAPPKGKTPIGEQVPNQHQASSLLNPPYSPPNWMPLQQTSAPSGPNHVPSKENTLIAGPTEQPATLNPLPSFFGNAVQPGQPPLVSASMNRFQNVSEDQFGSLFRTTFTDTSSARMKGEQRQQVSHDTPSQVRPAMPIITGATIRTLQKSIASQRPSNNATSVNQSSQEGRAKAAMNLYQTRDHDTQALHGQVPRSLAELRIGQNQGNTPGAAPPKTENQSHITKRTEFSDHRKLEARSWATEEVNYSYHLSQEKRIDFKFSRQDVVDFMEANNWPENLDTEQFLNYLYCKSDPGWSPNWLDAPNNTLGNNLTKEGGLKDLLGSFPTTSQTTESQRNGSSLKWFITVFENGKPPEKWDIYGSDSPFTSEGAEDSAIFIETQKRLDEIAKSPQTKVLKSIWQNKQLKPEARLQ